MAAREFNLDVSVAKREPVHGPMCITDRGEPTFVLLAIHEHRCFTETDADLVARLSMDDDDAVGFAPLNLEPRIAEL